MTVTVVLLSGGIDSSTLLHQERHPNAAVTGLFVHYGQRGAAQERAAARAQCSAAGAAFEELDISAAADAIRKGQINRMHVPLPHRNLVVLGLGLSFAQSRRADRLSLAVNLEDAQSYPSASQAFLEGFRSLARSLGTIEIAFPLSAHSKAEVIRLGTQLGADLSATYSCLLGRARHCGACPQCLKRRAAFAAAGRPDPTVYRRG